MQCVMKRFKCNGDNNCIDGSDEEWCCPKNKFLCPNGKCISTNHLCDGQDDCGDFADETHCGEKISFLKSITLIACRLSYIH